MSTVQNDPDLGDRPTSGAPHHLSQGGRQTRTLTVTALVAGAAIGAVLAVLIGAVLFPEQIFPLGHVAIAVIGSIAGAALGVFAVVARRSFRDTNR